MPKIELKDVTYYYLDIERKVGVAGIYRISASIPSQSFIIIVGPSGCGKTTLLKVIAGMLPPSEGTINFDEIDVAAIPLNERYVSFVSQEFALYPTMSVFENIAYPLKVARVPIEETRVRVNELATMLKIDHLLSRRPRHLSVGERQRVALARALIKRPHILFLDEPMSNLDDVNRTALREMLKNVQRRYGMTIMMSTHRQEDAYFLADLLIEMDNGGIKKVSPFKDGQPA